MSLEGLGRIRLIAPTMPQAPQSASGLRFGSPAEFQAFLARGGRQLELEPGRGFQVFVPGSAGTAQVELSAKKAGFRISKQASTEGQAGTWYEIGARPEAPAGTGDVGYLALTQGRKTTKVNFALTVGQAR